MSDERKLPPMQEWEYSQVRNVHGRLVISHTRIYAPTKDEAVAHGRNAVIPAHGTLVQDDAIVYTPIPCDQLPWWMLITRPDCWTCNP